MRKGVSTVIATILMLIITIALAGMAWAYMQGMFTTTTQGLEIVDAYCVESGQSAANAAECTSPPCDLARITIRNIGTSAVTTSGISFTQTAPSTDNLVSNSTWGTTTTLDPAVTAIWANTCGGSGGRNCYYRITPQQGKTVTASVYCT